jgi:hypothetical protein
MPQADASYVWRILGIPQAGLGNKAGLKLTGVNSSAGSVC